MGGDCPLICGMGVSEVGFEVGPCLVCRGFGVPAFGIFCKETCAGDGYLPMLMIWVYVLGMTWAYAIGTYLKMVFKTLKI